MSLKRTQRLVWPIAMLVGACAGAGRGGPGSTTPPSAAGRTFEELYEARADSARMRFSQVDVAFITSMIHHHAQALEMADLAPTREGGAAVKTLAARIINGQRDEIATMQRWLENRGQPVPDPYAPAAAGSHSSHGMTMPGMAPMPGMLTPAELARLQAARSQQFDQLFLTFMIRHHQGAVTMVHDLFANDDALQGEELFKIASDMQVDQTTEINRMQLLLDELIGPRLIR